jgi:hypothetical protein
MSRRGSSAAFLCPQFIVARFSLYGHWDSASRCSVLVSACVAAATLPRRSISARTSGTRVRRAGIGHRLRRDHRLRLSCLHHVVSPVETGLSSVRVWAASVAIADRIRRTCRVARVTRAARHARSGETTLRTLAAAAGVRYLAAVISLRDVQVLGVLGEVRLQLLPESLRIRMAIADMNLAVRVWIGQ